MDPCTKICLMISGIKTYKFGSCNTVTINYPMMQYNFDKAFLFYKEFISKIGDKVKYLYQHISAASYGHGDMKVIDWYYSRKQYKDNYTDQIQALDPLCNKCGHQKGDKSSETPKVNVAALIDTTHMSKCTSVI